MAQYDLYLESGPRKKKTMVHVIALCGCVATGGTTDDAIAATPAAIRAFQRFLIRHGVDTEEDVDIQVTVAEHITEGVFIGNGTPYITFTPDYEPIDDAEIEQLLQRIDWLSGDLSNWSAGLGRDQLEFAPPGGRATREVLLHIMGAQPSTLSIALGSAPGFGKVRSAAERGELPFPEALIRMAEMVRARIAMTAPEERNAVRRLDSGTFTLRKALRGSIEHLWDHLTELSRRPDGPTL